MAGTEMSFSSLVLSLGSTTYIYLGLTKDPHTQEYKKDFQAAQANIAILEMLQQKTEGNLTEEEDKFLRQILSDLQMQYVKNVTSSADSPPSPEKAATPKAAETMA